MITGKTIYIALTCVILVGCAGTVPKPLTDDQTGTGEGISSAHDGVLASQKAVAKAIPHADATGKELLALAIDNLTTVLSRLDDTLTAYSKAQTNAASLYHDVIVAKDETAAAKQQDVADVKLAKQQGDDALHEEQSHPLSYIQRKWAARVIIGGSLSVIGLLAGGIASTAYGWTTLGTVLLAVPKLLHLGPVAAWAVGLLQKGGGSAAPSSNTNLTVNVNDGKT